MFKRAVIASISLPLLMLAVTVTCALMLIVAPVVMTRYVWTGKL